MFRWHMDVFECGGEKVNALTPTTSYCVIVTEAAMLLYRAASLILASVNRNFRQLDIVTISRVIQQGNIRQF